MSPTATKDLPTATSTTYKPGEKDMLACAWQGKTDVRVTTVPKPTITDPTDIVIRSTGVTVCGSDLHLYHGQIPDTEKGQIVGHEGVGIVDQVGAQITKFKPGDRVVAAFNIACGTCRYCKEKFFTACERTNKSANMQNLYGQKIAGLLGYGHLLGGYAGTQAEYFRMPFGDVNCFHLPDNVPDEKGILLADVTGTAYHSVYDIQFKEGETAAVWGAGPIGQLICQWLTKCFGAKKVILIDNVVPRLQWAKDRLDIEVINFDQTPNVVEEIFKKVPAGVDVSFDAAGFRYAKSIVHKAMQAVGAETDTPENLNEAIQATRLGGRISVIADYVGLCNGLNIGAVMEKGIMLKGNGQAPVQKYLPDLIEKYVATGKFDPTLILTHRFKFDDIAQVYRAFDQKLFDEANAKPVIKTFLETKFSPPRAPGTPELSSVPGA